MINYDWKKLGRVYTLDKPVGDFTSHVTRPIPIWIEELGIIRVFFSSRNSDNVPLPNFIDLWDKDPTKILKINTSSLLSLGRPGTFDDSGITPTCIVENGNASLLYYVGWKRRRTENVTIEPSIGVCQIDVLQCKLFRMFEGPIIGQNTDVPIFSAAPFVIKSNNLWNMWLCSGISWKITNHGPEMIYSVISATSTDGIHWENFSNNLIPRRHDEEVISAPWITINKNLYEMWFSFRGINSKEEKNFRIGYAYSKDGVHWNREDCATGLAPSTQGWDSEMMCYPSILKVKDATYCFYSGNDVGKAGFGVAKLVTA